MHLLAATPGGYSDESQVITAEQQPADWVILTAADTEAMLLSRTYRTLDNLPSLRIGHLNNLRNNASIDLYVDEVLQHAKVIVAVLLGGIRYWSYLSEQLIHLKESGVQVIFLSGDDIYDAELMGQSSVGVESVQELWQYLRYGGIDNTRAFLESLNALFNDGVSPQPPKAMAEITISWRESPVDATTVQSHWQPGRPVVSILYYKSHLASANVDAINGLCDALINEGLNPLPIAVSSLKNEVVLEGARALIRRFKVATLIDTTAFAVQPLEQEIGHQRASLFGEDTVILQAILVGTTEQTWRTTTHGLSPRELAMHVVLPEVDGKVIGAPISFKEVLYYDENLQISIVGHRHHPAGAQQMARLAKRYEHLKRSDNSEKRVALLFANYPISDARIANGVGLDVPNSAVAILEALKANGYSVENPFNTGDELIEELIKGATNNSDMLPIKKITIRYPVTDYLADCQSMSASLLTKVNDRWGEAKDDPFTLDEDFCIAGISIGNVFIGIQPPRGYQIDLDANYHDPDLIPPHYYLAFYSWLRHAFKADAIIQLGKHGNLEWLPGKSVALSEECWPAAVMGSIPNFYPFIVNDPGEGTQAKRRTHSVIIDHLMPPLVRAENYGNSLEIERLVDEYYHAAQLDPRRATLIKKDIGAAVKDANLDRDLKIDSRDLDENALNSIDTYLCELKESQIRGGLHIIGSDMPKEAMDETLLSLVQLPRSSGIGKDDSLIIALAKDFSFESPHAIFEQLGNDWLEDKPTELAHVDDSHWRTKGDTLERLKLFALKLIRKEKRLTADCTHTKSVLQFIHDNLLPIVQESAHNEVAAIINALNGKAISAGPSGAPSRGRLDILPTGRNFYSVDTRAIPTQSAWRLGFAAANAFIERYVQDHGEYPNQITISLWGTSTMRTGGDDIAQILAFIGARPIWDSHGQRVVDFEILPVSVLDRPRVDITVRISGFFRDAFENIVSLLDAAFKKVAALEESIADNPLKHNSAERLKELIDDGLTEDTAKEQAQWRIFGSKPGSYGAGLQGLIEHRNWDDKNDLGRAFINWSSYAYGQNTHGEADSTSLINRLKMTQAIVHNQDNREHDILDSDDYYQFQGGLAAAAHSLGNENVPLYHGDNQNPAQPKVRSLGEEINRVIRSRALNPKWIDAMQRHGYKGAFEMAATVDYLFAFDATTELVEDWHYEAMSETYLFDDASRAFFERHNPAALRDMAERMLEAIQREMWHNSKDYEERLTSLIIDTEHLIETNGT